MSCRFAPNHRVFTRVGWWLAICVGLISMARAVPPSPWAVRVWRADGLPDTLVKGVVQTSDGFIWVATPGHFSRFDGNRFESFAGDTFVPGLGHEIQTLMQDRAGHLWAAANRGPVIGLIGERGQTVTGSLPDSFSTSMAEDAEGGIWVAYTDGSICRIYRGEVHVFNDDDGVSTTLRGATVAVDNTGRVWFAKGEHVGVWEGGRLKSLVKIDRLVKRLTAARGGGMWVCSGVRLFKCDEQGTLDYKGTLPAQNSGARPHVMLEDRSGALWIGTAPGGLFYYDGTSFQSVPTSDPEIVCLLEDREGNIWAGTNGGGLIRIRPRALTVEGATTGFPSESVRLLGEDSRGQLWAVTQDRRLVQRIDDSWSPPAHGSTQLRGLNVAALSPGREGSIWLGTDSGKLMHLRGESVTTLGRNDGLAPQSLNAILVARDSTVWIAGSRPLALQSFNGKTFTDFELPTDAPPIRLLAEAPGGDIWAGGDKGSLWRVTGGRLVDEAPRLSPLRQRIHALYFSPDGVLWIAYRDGGVARVKDGQVALIRAEHGLYDDEIAQILADDQGWLWFGSRRGLFKVRLAELEAVAEGRAARVQSVRYGEQGPVDLQVDFTDSSLALRTRDGRLWFPMGPTLAVIELDKLRADFTAPTVLIRSLTVDADVVGRYGGLGPPAGSLDLRTPTRDLRLSAAHRKVEFDFTALSFAAAENVQFRYRLVGFDAGWTESGTQRSASFSRLAPGDYRFEVKACNGDGIWGETPAVLAFSVVPLWWQAFWFRLSVFGGMTVAMFAIVRFVSVRRLRHRLRELQQQSALEKERGRIARDLHDDLGGRLTQVVLLNELALQDNALSDPVGQRIRESSRATREAIKSLDETVWALNPRNDTLPDLIDYFSQFAVEFLRAAGIRCRAELPDHPPKLAVPAEARHHLFLVVKEALNNVVRHARATEVEVRVTLVGEELGVLIADNGRGFSGAASDAQANGLRNMRERMAEIGGAVEIVSSPAGTHIALRWQIPH